MTVANGWSEPLHSSSLTHCSARLYIPLCLLSTHALEVTTESQLPGLEYPAQVQVDASHLQCAELLIRTAKV